MKTLIIYKSIHKGNTEKIAEGISQVLDAQLLKPHQMDKHILPNYDLVGLGSGIYFGRHHNSLFELAEKCSPLHKKKVFIFSTSSIMPIPLIYNINRPLINKLKEINCQILGTFNCRGSSEAGILRFLGGIHKTHPDQKDITKAKVFAQQIKNTAQQHS